MPGSNPQHGERDSGNVAEPHDWPLSPSQTPAMDDSCTANSRESHHVLAVHGYFTTFIYIMYTTHVTR